MCRYFIQSIDTSVVATLALENVNTTRYSSHCLIAADPVHPMHGEKNPCHRNVTGGFGCSAPIREPTVP